MKRLAVLVLVSLACSGSDEPTIEAPDPAPDPEVESSARVSTERVEIRRILVTGFNDWKQLGDPPNTWRCRDNPSCRLLVGEEEQERPQTYDGPLASRLPDGEGIDWEFATMPVTWGAFDSLETDDYDIVINMGLGVYDRFDRLQLEQGAFNERKGTDAAGQAAAEPIDAAQGSVRSPPEDSGIATRLEALAGARFAGYEIAVTPARPENSYLCNETHYRALGRLDESRARSGRLSQVYFLHIPYAENGDYESLASGVAELLRALVR